MAILVYALRSEISGVITNLGQINAIALLFLIPIEILNYDAYARLYRNLFEILGEKVRYWSMYKLGLELNFVNHILPSGGVSGISYFGIRQKQEGIGMAKSSLAQITKFFLLFVSFQPLLILGIFLLAMRDHVNNLVLVTFSSLITLLIVFTLIGVYMIESRKRINMFLTALSRALNGTVRILLPMRKKAIINIEHAQRAFDELHDNYIIYKRNWRKLKKPFLYMTVANVTEIAALYMVYIAFGEYVNIGAIILAYAVANFAGLISVLPAGIGVYEGLMTAVLAATGIPLEVSIPVTVTYRVINMSIQLLPGYYFYQKSLGKHFSKKAS
jgi:uncharacterized protein (TIRG00374 family)